MRLTRFVTDGLSHLVVFSCCTQRFTPMTCIELLALIASTSTSPSRLT